MTALVTYDAARYALRHASTVDDAADIRDKAEALRVYAKQRGNVEMECWVAEIKVRASRRIGELSKGLETSPGARSDLEPLISGDQRLKKEALKSAGLSWGVASRCERIAALDEGEFEAHIAKAAMDGRAITAEEVLKAVAKRAKREHIAEAAPMRHWCQVDDLARFADGDVKCGTVYADPAWQYGNQSTRGATDNHYIGMSVDEICSLPVERIVAANAHLHLWTTNTFLFDAKRVIEAWGFEYRSCYVWVKPQIGMGNYWRVSHEFLLLGIRGSATFTDKGQRSWGEFPRRQHSSKPEEIRHLVECVSPGPRIELFARRKAPGWYAWGNEIQRSVFDAALEAVA